jgi:dipeptide transport system permease protein
MIIPAFALALFPAAVLARYTRSSMLEVLSADYVRTARAKGLSEWTVVTRHAVRNALLPVVTVGAIILADVVTGSFYVETIYQVPGIGRYFVDSITSRDYPVILGTVLLFGALVSVMNLLVDIVYPLLDPRMGK